MRIKQAQVTLKFFRDGVYEKYKLEGYSDRTKPVIFFGGIESVYETIMAHEALMVIVWNGSDVMTIKPGFHKYLLSRPDVKHIAVSSYIANDLQKLGLEYVQLPLSLMKFDDFKLKPLGKCVYMYSSHADPEFYGEHHLRKLKKMFPGLIFMVRYVRGANSVKRTQLPDLYRKCFMGLRLTPHDGCSCTAIELGLMGRRIVWNGDSPNAIKWRTLDDVAAAIREETKYIGQVREGVRTAVENFINVPEYWLDTDFYV